MKVSRLGERVVQKGEIPKGLHLVVEGEAQAVYDDAVQRELCPSTHCRAL